MLYQSITGSKHLTDQEKKLVLLQGYLAIRILAEPEEDEVEGETK